MTPAASAIGQLLRIIAGMLIWASAFVFLYAGQSLACQHIIATPVTGRANPVTALLLALALLHLAVLGGLLLRWFRHPPPPAGTPDWRVRLFCHRLEGLVLALSMAGLLWLAVPILMVLPCGA